MRVPEKSREYLKQATECEEAAKAATDPQAKAQFEALTRQWRRLAEQRGHSDREPDG